MSTPDTDTNETPEDPEPVYDAMIRRQEDGPDPLVPEPAANPKTGEKGK
jgi:hypothetical protein